MTDFHDELGQRLHAAARRRARRPWLAPLAPLGPRSVAAVAVVAVVAVVVVVVGMPEAEPEREVAAPSPPTASGCPEKAPPVLSERFAVMRREASPQADVGLPVHEVGHMYGAETRVVRYGSGLELLAVPALIGGCEAPNALPAVCLMPHNDSRWPADCRAVERDPGWPVVVALRQANEHGETEIAGIVSDTTGGAVITWPGGRLEVENEGGRIEATVKYGEPARVGITPVAGP